MSTVDLTLTRVSISPFDLGMWLPEDFEKTLHTRGYRPPAGIGWSGRLIGEDLVHFARDDAHSLVFARDGFGLLVRRTQYSIQGLGDFEGIARVLVERDRHHGQVREGKHEDVVTIRDVKRFVSQARAVRERERLDLWESPPYTLSFFHISGSMEALLVGGDSHRGLSALLDPSQVRSSHAPDGVDPILASATLIESLSETDVAQRHSDADMKATCAALCSWAGMVVFDGSGADLSYYESLELRLQFAWSRAHLVRRWAEKSVADRRGVSDLLRLATQVRPILRQSKRIIDASASSRDQRLFDELVATSALAREIADAEEAINDLEALIESERAVVRRRYDRTIEGLLIALAVLQVVPLVIKTPIAQFDPRWLLAVLAAVAAFIWFRARQP